MHETVTQRVFVGDVQGCIDELEDLLAALRYDPAQHRVFFVGDLVNRGPGSARTLRRAIDLGADSVLGNHDLHLLAVAAGERTANAGDTLDDVLAAPDREQLLAWLRHRPLVIDWPDIILVHAGLHPRWRDPKAVARPLETKIATGVLPLEDPTLQFLTRVRYCDAGGRRIEAVSDPGPPWAPWDEFYRGERIVVCGHWAVRGVAIKPRLRALDSGCVWGGKLTAWIAEEDRLLSVPARRAYQQPG